MALVVFAAGGALASAGAAAAVNYWGYNNLSRTNPPAGTCSGQGAAIACSGFAGWVETDIDMPSGDAITAIGFQNCTGCHLWKVDNSPSAVFAAVGKGFFGGSVNNTNRSICLHDENLNTYKYAQCRVF